ncbi:hypothetical protein EMCRGX_G027497 [Ephydatia muelleri]
MSSDQPSEDSANVQQKQKKQRKSDDGGISKEGAWLNVHHDPVASLYTFSACMALEDLNNDGEYKLLVGDLGTGQSSIKLKMYEGTQLKFETPLLDLPTGICTFYMDTTIPRTPAIAVASGPFVYIYKNLRPYFKFTLPGLDLNQMENDLWLQVKEDKMDATVLREALETLYKENSGVPLTSRSLKFLRLDPEDCQPFVSVFKHVPLKRQSVTTSITTLHKSYAERDAVSCLVVTAENSYIYVLDPEAFTILTRMKVPSAPVFVTTTGLFDVDYCICVACRDATIYTLKKGDTGPQYRISLSSQPCGLLSVDKTIIAGAMDNTLSCHLPKGKRLWSINLPETITCMEVLDQQHKGYKAVLVGMANREVRVYRDRFLVNTITMDDIIVGMKFGRFGREEGALLMVGRGGALSIKMLRRTVSFENKEARAAPAPSQAASLDIPKKTKVFVDQTVRERDNPCTMHNAFQKDLYRLRLGTAKAFAKSLKTSSAPITSTHSMNISAQVQGMGPLFRLTISVQNSSPTAPIIDHYITFKCDYSLYRLSRPRIELPLLVPSLSYSLESMVECLDETGRTGAINVLVLRKGSPVPLITALVNMPVSEVMVMS